MSNQLLELQIAQDCHVRYGAACTIVAQARKKLNKPETDQDEWSPELWKECVQRAANCPDSTAAYGNLSWKQVNTVLAQYKSPSLTGTMSSASSQATPPIVTKESVSQTSDNKTTSDNKQEQRHRDLGLDLPNEITIDTMSVQTQDSLSRKQQPRQRSSSSKRRASMDSGGSSTLASHEDDTKSSTRSKSSRRSSMSGGEKKLKSSSSVGRSSSRHRSSRRASMGPTMTTTGNEGIANDSSHSMISKEKDPKAERSRSRRRHLRRASLGPVVVAADELETKSTHKEKEQKSKRSNSRRRQPQRAQVESPALSRSLHKEKDLKTKSHSSSRRRQSRRASVGPVVVEDQSNPLSESIPSIKTRAKSRASTCAASVTRDSSLNKKIDCGSFSTATTMPSVNLDASLISLYIEDGM